MLRQWGVLALFILTLAGCGGSSGGPSGSKTTDNTNTTDSSTGGGNGSSGDQNAGDGGGTGTGGGSVPDVIQDDPAANVGIGWGIGTEHQSGVAYSQITTLTSGGSTSVRVNLVDVDNGNAIYTGQRTIAFNSYCAQLGLAEFNPPVIEAAGLATSNYVDKGCGQTDNIIVSLIRYGADHTEENPKIEVIATAVTEIDVKLPVVGVLSFVDAVPATIALKGNGSESFPETSVIRFRLLDQNGNPMFSKEVRFEMDHERGGARLARTSAVTDAEGYVDVRLAAGRAHGEVRILASTDIHDEDGNFTGVLENQSSIPITMTTGLPDENSFELAANIYNPHSWDNRGTSITVTAMLADHYGNPVPDGTGVSFSTESGIVGRSCETTNGRCSVTWQAQGEDPIDGIATIVARTVAEGNFQDLNSNGMFDVGEPFHTFAEPYLDANGTARISVPGIDGYDPTNVYNPHVDLDGDGTNEFLWSPTETNFFEEFYDVNENGVADLVPGDKFQGLRCSDAAISQGHCAEMVELSKSIEVIVSQGNAPFIEGPFVETTLGSGLFDDASAVSCIDVSGVNRNIMWRVSDSLSRRNKLPNGTNIRFAFDGWIQALSGGNDEAIGSYNAPLRYDLWKHWRGYSQSTNNDTTRYEYLNYRGHTFTMGLARDDTYSGIRDYFADHSITVEKDGRSTEVSLRVSALGYFNKFLKSDTGDYESTIDVSGGEKIYRVEVVTPCGVGFEPGAVISLQLNNGTNSAADWLTSSEGAFQSKGTGTAAIVVTQDGRAGGNWMEFRVRGDGTPSLNAETGLTVTVRDGTVAERTETVASVQD